MAIDDADSVWNPFGPLCLNTASEDILPADSEVLSRFAAVVGEEEISFAHPELHFVIKNAAYTELARLIRIFQRKLLLDILDSDHARKGVLAIISNIKGYLLQSPWLNDLERILVENETTRSDLDGIEFEEELLEQKLSMLERYVDVSRRKIEEVNKRLREIEEVKKRLQNLTTKTTPAWNATVVSFN